MVQEINKIFPEFKDSKGYDKDCEDLPYIFMGNFANFAVRELNNNNYKLSNRIIDFVNRVYEGSNSENKNIICIDFFQTVCSDSKWHSLLLTSLTGEAKEDYIKYVGK